VPCERCKFSLLCLQEHFRINYCLRCHRCFGRRLTRNTRQDRVYRPLPDDCPAPRQDSASSHCPWCVEEAQITLTVWSFVDALPLDPEERS
jgi:hypothetical protein